MFDGERASRRDGREGYGTLFIVGSGRSGTTLIYELLCVDRGATWVSNYSQRVSVLARLHPRSPGAFKGSTSRFAVRPVEGYRLFNSIRGTSGVGDDSVLLASDLSDSERVALRRAVTHHLSRRDATYFVNKNTRNTRRIGYLNAAFPEARFVHVIRHPVAAVGSMLVVPFFDDIRVWWLGGQRVGELVRSGHDRTHLAAEIWAREVAACESALSGIQREQWTNVYYEDFVEDPQSSLALMLDLVGAPLSGEVEEQALRRDVDNRNSLTFGRLTTEQRESIWTIVGETAARHGYSLGDDGRGAL